MSDTVLLCTVGGSPEPVLRAISSLKPAYVCFFSTDRDPATKKPGSKQQVVGNSDVGIAARAGLAPDQFDIELVPADDMDAAYLKMRQVAAKMAEPGRRLVVNYTGGTKTMTAALVCAALERDDTSLQLVSGARPGLDKVQSGTEEVLTASVDRLRLDRAMARHLDAWQRHAYAEAAEGLRSIQIGSANPDRLRLTHARALSGVFALWDNFDHKGAWAKFEPFKDALWQCYPALWSALDALRRERNPDNPLPLWDLWRNAERRAAQGRYDDAVARWYRFVEWTAQWLIRRRCGAETADFPRERLPEGLALEPGADGKVKLALTNAWRVVAACYKEDAPGRFHEAHANDLHDLLKRRNSSILAHGFNPVTSDDWGRVLEFNERHFLPMLRDATGEAKLKFTEPEQLPTEAPGSATGLDVS